MYTMSSLSNQYASLINFVAIILRNHNDFSSILFTYRVFFMMMITYYPSFIDSQVFAEEVEPTGAVPIEMSLERYRYAALPNKFKEMSDDQRLQPRVMLKFFSGSHILGQVNTRDHTIYYTLKLQICIP